MTKQGDPQGREPQALLEAADFTKARVLEIGCGDGGLAFRYAQAARFVAGVDTKPPEVQRAAQSSPAGLGNRMRFLLASATTLPFRDETFEIALLGRAL